MATAGLDPACLSHDQALGGDHPRRAAGDQVERAERQTGSPPGDAGAQIPVQRAGRKGPAHRLEEPPDRLLVADGPGGKPPVEGVQEIPHLPQGLPFQGRPALGQGIDANGQDHQQRNPVGQGHQQHDLALDGKPPAGTTAQPPEDPTPDDQGPHESSQPGQPGKIREDGGPGPGQGQGDHPGQPPSGAHPPKAEQEVALSDVGFQCCLGGV